MVFSQVGLKSYRFRFMKIVKKKKNKKVYPEKKNCKKLTNIFLHSLRCVWRWARCPKAGRKPPIPPLHPLPPPLPPPNKPPAPPQAEEARRRRKRRARHVRAPLRQRICRRWSKIWKQRQCCVRVSSLLNHEKLFMNPLNIL